MPEAFQYALLQVVPRVERGERMNAGVVVYCRRHGFLQARVHLDEGRLSALDPGADAAEVRRHLDALVAVAAGEGDDDTVAELREHVAKKIGKLARPKRIIWADDLPKTRSGKIMRRLLRDIAEGRELGDVTTLRDPDVMAQLEGKIKERQADEE